MINAVARHGGLLWVINPLDHAARLATGWFKSLVNILYLRFGRDDMRLEAVGQGQGLMSFRRRGSGFFLHVLGSPGRDAGWF